MSISNSLAIFGERIENLTREMADSREQVNTLQSDVVSLSLKQAGLEVKVDSLAQAVGR